MWQRKKLFCAGQYLELALVRLDRLEDRKLL
jgi:hypothetical protein